MYDLFCASGMYFTLYISNIDSYLYSLATMYNTKNIIISKLGMSSKIN